MFDVDLAFPLSAGLVAAFNPCGFAMLPAYMSYFLGLESDDETNMARNVLRSLVVGLTMTAGFMLVFGTIGILTSTFLSEGTLSRNAPYATLVFGVLMIPLGIAMLRGFEPKLNIRRVQWGGGSNQLPSVFLFGVSYAIVSISCTIGIFLGVVAGSFDDDGIVNGTMIYLAYAAGMGLVIMTLSLSVALARNSVASNMRRVLPYVNKVSGIMLVLAGIYLLIYGWWEVQVLRGNTTGTNPVVDAGEGVRTTLQQWVSDVGEARLALGILVVLIGVLVFVMSRSLGQRDRWIARGGFTALWLLIELVPREYLARGSEERRFELLIRPILRSIAAIPERIGNWFTDPLRWPVLWELMAATIIGTIVWFTVRSVRRRLGPTDETESMTDVPVSTA